MDTGSWRTIISKRFWRRLPHITRGNIIHLRGIGQATGREAEVYLGDLGKNSECFCVSSVLLDEDLPHEVIIGLREIMKFPACMLHDAELQDFSNFLLTGVPDGSSIT